MRAPISQQWQQPNPRGKLLGFAGLFIALGFAVVIGILLSAVAQSQVARDPKEGGTPLDIRSVTVEHGDRKVVARINLYKPVRLNRLPGGSKLWISLHPGGDQYFVMEMTLEGPAVGASLTPCDADACHYDLSMRISGKMIGKRSFKMSLSRAALPSLGDRVEWQAGSLHGTHRIDQAPDDGFKILHL